MNSAIRSSARTGNPAREELETLYVEFLKRYYEENNSVKAERVAARLDTLLAESNECAESIRGEEIRSLIAELRGNLNEAIQSREAEIRKILELHTLSLNTPSWPYVSRQYNHGDVSDRLDLLAILYDKRGELDRAIAVLLESKRYCESHGIQFDATDLLGELEQARSTHSVKAPTRDIAQDKVDGTIRRVYQQFSTGADEIVVSDRLARDFTKAVNEELPETSPVSVEDVRRRLLTLRRRGEARGGLPRLNR